MELLKDVFSRTYSKTTEEKSNLDAIKNLFEEYSCEELPVNQCLAKTGSQTADLVIYQISNVKVPDPLYDSIVLLITNYYAMLHVADMYTDYYVPDKKNTFDRVAGLMEDILNETVQNRGLKDCDFGQAMIKSREYTRQYVEVFYRAGLEGCYKYLTTSIYSVLLYANQASAVKKQKIEQIIRAIQADKVLYQR